METSLNWIKSYVPELCVTPQDYMDAMTLTGTKVEGYRALDENLEKIVVGEILKIEAHPDADKLVVCQVNIGEDEPTQIVTGATNVSAGDKVPVVLHGGRVATDHDGNKVPGGTKIKNGKLRGVESFGMMCSVAELGYGTDLFPDAAEDGIYILPKESTPGMSVPDMLGLHDTVFEYEITSNRVDCFGTLGIAREVAATFDKTFVMPEEKATGDDRNTSDFVSVDIKDRDLCPRYMARVLTDVKVAPSPKWMQERLRSLGIRPINNLVDTTNFVMEEFGQPMHAFDLKKVKDGKIIVKRAEEGEKFVTLDGEERTLDNNMLAICDSEKTIALAGIMGGENSMITDETETLILECACFDGTNIRLSSKRAGLRTDASGKFEKGLDPENVEAAMNRACALLEEMGAGKVVGGKADVYPVKREEKRIPFDADAINGLLGTDISKDAMIKYFEKIELKYDAENEEIVVPTFRQDLLRSCDLAEEIARFFGYDNIPTSLPTGEATVGRLPFKQRIENVARDVAECYGFSEGFTYSFESPKVFDKLSLEEDAPERQAIKISNPLGEDFSIMRTMPVNGMLTSLGNNFSHRNMNVRLYELGNIYIPKELPLTSLPDERMQLTLGMYGEGDFFSLKGVIEAFLGKIGFDGTMTYSAKVGKTFLHPGRKAEISYEGKVLGYLGEVHPVVAKRYGIGTKAYIAVLDMPVITELATFDRKYKGIAKFPAMMRDISMVVPKNVTAGEIVAMIRQRGGKDLESVTLFDLYEGKQVKAGHKSMAYTLSFRAKDRTLTENEVSSAMKKILHGLSSLDIELRK